jgi:hypothetical protein
MDAVSDWSHVTIRIRVIHRFCVIIRVYNVQLMRNFNLLKHFFFAKFLLWKELVLFVILFFSFGHDDRS